MARIRRTEVTVETDEIMIIQSSQSQVVTPCPVCAEAIVMITPEQAAMMSCINVRSIYRCVEEGRLHHSETPEGLLLICPRSLEEAAIRAR